jgi:hypothetical protein
MKLKNIEIKTVNMEKTISGEKITSLVISKKNSYFVVNNKPVQELFVPLYYDGRQAFFMNCGRRVDVNILPSNDIELIQYNLSLKEVI